MRNVRQLVYQGFFLFASLFSSGSFAGSDGFEVDGTRWACWYSPANLSVTCLLSRASSGGGDLRPAGDSGTTGRRPPESVRTIQDSPEKLAGAGVNIPLMSIPYEIDFVRILAKAVMCGHRADCSVFFDPNLDGMAHVRGAALAAGASEADVMAEFQGMLQRNVRGDADSDMPRLAKRKRGMQDIRNGEG